jgi:hypothetical protein
MIGFKEPNVDNTQNNRPLLTQEKLDQILQHPSVQHLGMQYVVLNPYYQTPEKDKILDSLDTCTQNLSEQQRSIIQANGLQYLRNGPSSSQAFATKGLNQNSQELETFVFLPNVIELSTVDVIHELGHVIDYDILQIQDSKYISKGGFELTLTDTQTGEWRDIKIENDGSITKSEVTGRRRHYELLNEVVHDMISIKVAQHYENSTGKKIGFKESSASPSIYSRNFPILADFVESDLDRIIDCKMASDMNVTAAKYFGYDGLNKLAQINETYMSEKSKLMSISVRFSLNMLHQITKDGQRPSFVICCNLP